jgi:LysM repeat protein
MIQIRRSVLVFASVVIATMFLSACTQSLSAAPAGEPTLIPTGLFVSPIASVENPMEMIEQFAKQTQAAQTSVAGGGTTGTPQVAVTGTPGVDAATATPTAPVNPSTPTNANPVAATTSAPPVGTPIPPGSRPSEYVLREGEFPYCIARRYNVDPEALLSASGLTSPDVYYAGLKLIIPQNAGAFPGTRALKAHPAAYTVASTGETPYSVACLYGDVTPEAIVSANSGVTLATTFTVGQVVQIP